MPGFGAFINVRHAARCEKGVWYPMTREVRFNAALQHDDGLLASSYARKLRVSFQEGREALSKATSRLLEALRMEGEVTLGQLGILRLEGESVRFVPRMPASRMAAILGFTEVDSIRRKGVSTTDGKPVAVSPVKEENSNKVYGEPKRHFDTDRNYYIAVNKVFARTAAVFLLVVAVAVSVLVPVGRQQVVEDKASVVPVEKIITTAVKPMAEKIAETAPEPRHESTEAPAPVVEKPEGRYHLIVATFRSQGDAETFVAQHADSGYSLRVVGSKKTFRVSAMAKETAQEAFAVLNTPEFQNSFSQAWVWEQPQ